MHIFDKLKTLSRIKQQYFHGFLIIQKIQIIIIFLCKLFHLYNIIYKYVFHYDMSYYKYLFSLLIYPYVTIIFNFLIHTNTIKAI